MPNMDYFKGKRIIATEKMDGENTTMYRDHIHARSINSDTHISRNWVKNFWSTIAHEIPEGWRICGENLWAEHSIGYTELPTYFMGFSIWNEKNECLSWDETLEWFKLLGITPVPVMYDGIFEDCDFKTFMSTKEGWVRQEGYVIRIADKFSYGEFRKSVGKFVRLNHIQTVKHWMHGKAVEQNLLKQGE
jgi:hypothetical protein